MKENTNKVTRTFAVKGLGCPMCVKRVDKALCAVEGVENVVVSLEAANAEVTYDENVCKAETLQQAVKDAGYEMIID